MKPMHPALRALAHPLSLLSIALLLANDHLLKAAYPSPLTGKLSDFAGLFFFPFLLAACFSLLLGWLRWPPRRTAALAFLLTGLGFSLVKLSPQVNEAAVRALSSLLPAQVQILRDPGDLLALAVLWPAWRLWQEVERRPGNHPPGRLVYLALGLASLAALATSCPELLSVRRLAEGDGVLYAGMTTYYEPEVISRFAASLDGGRTWQPLNVEELPPGIGGDITRPVNLPVIACDPSAPQACYRAAGEEQVEASEDGGRTWKSAWRVPWGRRQFIDAYLRRVASCKRDIDLGPYDLIFFNQDGQPALAAAMGSEGMLVRLPQGKWARYNILSATATPFHAELLALPLLLLAENAIFLLLTFLTWLALSLWAWRNIMAGRRAALAPDSPATGASSPAAAPSGRPGTAVYGTAPSQRPLSWALLPAVLGITLALASACLLLTLFNQMGSGAALLLLPLTALPLLLGPALSWRRFRRLAPQPAAAGHASRAAAGASFALLLAWLPFPLWAFGLLPVYPLALALAVLVGIAVLAWGARRVDRLSRQAGMPSLPGRTAENAK